MVTTSATTFPSGEATYSCDEGYNLAGMETRSCQDSGSWSGEPATCESTYVSTTLHELAQVIYNYYVCDIIVLNISKKDHK